MTQLTAVDLNQLGIDAQSNEMQFIRVSAAAISRTYAILFMCRQMFVGREHMEETPVLYGNAVRESMKALARTYPDFEDFQFDVKVCAINKDISIFSTNDFTNTIMTAINASLETPVIDYETTDGAVRPEPMLNVIDDQDWDDEEDWDEDE